MEHPQSPLSDDRLKLRRQRSAIVSLQKAFTQCQKADLVIIGHDQSLMAFDQDKLFASGWNPDEENTNLMDRLGRQRINTDDAFIVCLSRAQHPGS